jgi:hypothetical protein
MAIDQDMLATLKRIENLMKSQTTTSPAGAGVRARIAGGNSDDAGGSKKSKTYRGTAKSIEGLGDAADALNGSFNGLNRTVKMTRANFVAMNRQMRSFGKIQPQAAPQGVMQVAQPTPAIGNTSPGAQKAAGASVTKQANNTASALKGVAGAAWRGVKSLGALAGIAKDVANDMFFFASRGLSAGAGFQTLYVDAIKAGMGVREYTQVLADNTPAVIRARSNEEFGKSLDQTRDKLAGLGIFGEEATKLGAGMMNSATVVGISQNAMDDAVSKQVAVYTELRKTTMMTASQFQALSHEMSENSTVQETMQGLAIQERGARMQQIMQIQTLGLRLGATEKASRALGEALMNQRNSTLKSRFEAQGLARQASAVFGMDSGQAERLATLSRRKNLTAEESAEMQRLGATLNARIQTAMNSGNVNQEFMAEEFMERLNGTNLGKILSASGEVQNAVDSGPLANKDFGKGASDLMQGAGKLLTYAEGLSKNPIAMGSTALVAGLAGAATSAIVAAIGSKGFAGALASAVGGLKSLPGKAVGAVKAVGSGAMAVGRGAVGLAMAAGPAAMKALGAISNMIKMAGPIVAGIAAGAKSLFGGISNFVTGGLSKITTLIGGAGGLLPAIGKGLKMIPGLGTIGATIFSSISELVSGDVTNAFNADGGNWLSRIGNSVFAGITSVFGGIADMVDGVIKFFGGDGLDLRNAFDKFAVVMRGGFFAALASIAKVVTLGSDNTLSKYFQEAADNSFKVLDQLSADQTATISSIGESNSKKLEAQKKDAKTVNDTVQTVAKAVNASAGVVSSTTGIAGAAVNSARSIVATSTPVQPAPAAKIVEPDASKNELNNAAQSAKASSANSSIPDSTAQLASSIQELVSLIREGNNLSASQLSAVESLARAAGRTSSSDNSNLLDALASRS